MKAKNRNELLTAFLERRKNLMEPAVDIIWDLTKNIDNRSGFRSAVNHLFRNDAPGNQKTVDLDLAIQRFYKSKVEAEGYEYILSIDHHLSKIANEKF